MTWDSHDGSVEVHDHLWLAQSRPTSSAQTGIETAAVTLDTVLNTQSR
jgi:hypothetical protein